LRALQLHHLFKLPAIGVSAPKIKAATPKVVTTNALRRAIDQSARAARKVAIKAIAVDIRVQKRLGLT
jgi:hypothetical protein